MPAGRPSKYTAAIVDEICERIANGESLKKICEAKNKPGIATVFDWLAIHPEFADKYTRARQAQAEGYADEIVEIADSGDTERIRVQVDARKWIASKLLAKKYGDKVQAELTGPEGAPLLPSITLKLVRPEDASRS